MSGSNENTDPSPAVGASIHLNETDWLQLLQKLTPSSIDTLQHTLKKLQQTSTPSENSNPPTGTTQVYVSPLVSTTTSDTNTVTSQSVPSLLMSLNVAKAKTVSPILTVPSVLNVNRPLSKPMQNTIVLPSSTLLITPGTHGQSISLESCISGVNRLLVSGAGGALNTAIATAASVASSTQAQTPSPLATSMSTTSTPSPVITTSSSKDSSSNATSAFTTPASVRSTIDGLFSSLCGRPSQATSDLSQQLLTSLSHSGLTVYPVQVASNGSTVFLAAQPLANNKSYLTLPAGLNMIGATSSPCSTSTTPLSPLLATASPLLTSTPVNKPKFKALWEADNRASLTLVPSSAETTKPGDSGVQHFVLTDTAGSINSSLARLSTAGQLLGLQTVGKAPKRGATDEQPMLHALDGPKRLLLVTSQPKPISGDSGLVSTTESLLSKALQSRLVASTRELSNILSSDLRPAMSTPVNILPDIRPHVATGSSELQDRNSAYSPVEAAVGRNLEAIHRVFKEEPVGEDEARRRAKRRERNRVAAARCRQRRQDQISELQHRVSNLTKTGEELRCSLVSLDAERSRLETLVRQHVLEGCTEAEELLNTLFTTISPIPGSVPDPQQSQPRASVSGGSSSSTATNNMNHTISTSATSTGVIHHSSPSFIVIANSMNEGRLTTSTAPPNLVLPSTHSEIRNTASSVKVDDATSTTDSRTRVVATRPMTLIPPTQNPKPPSLSNNENTTPVSSGIPTPCFWPADLQTFAPLLTPSAVKLVKNSLLANLTSPQAVMNLFAAAAAMPNKQMEANNRAELNVNSQCPSSSSSSTTSTTTTVTVKPEPVDEMDGMTSH